MNVISTPSSLIWFPLAVSVLQQRAAPCLKITEICVQVFRVDLFSFWSHYNFLYKCYSLYLNPFERFTDVVAAVGRKGLPNGMRRNAFQRRREGHNNNTQLATPRRTRTAHPASRLPPPASRLQPPACSLQPPASSLQPAPGGPRREPVQSAA